MLKTLIVERYLFNEDVASAYGITNANPQFGNGGLPQYYVPDVQDLINIIYYAST